MAVTVLEVIQRSSNFLARKGVESPRLQAELLLAHVLELPRLKLYLDFERPLTERELEQVRELVKRRGQREPLQHLLGQVSFCGLELRVNREVLIPRPETELLAERGWQFLGELVARGITEPKVLDFGTGSGCLAITLACKCPEAQVVALDVSEAAIKVARQNAEQHRVHERIQFLAGDAFAPLAPGWQFHLVISNPPYIPAGAISSLQPEVRDYDPRRALDGGDDGLAMIRLLARETPDHLAAGGKLLMEFGDGQEGSVQSIFQQAGWTRESIMPDYSGRPRILIANRTIS